MSRANKILLPIVFVMLLAFGIMACDQMDSPKADRYQVTYEPHGGITIFRITDTQTGKCYFGVHNQSVVEVACPR